MMNVHAYSVAEITLLLSIIASIHWQEFLCEEVELSLLDRIQIYVGYMEEPHQCPNKEDVIAQVVVEFLTGVGVFIFPNIVVVVLCGFLRVVAASLCTGVRLTVMASILFIMRPFNFVKVYSSRLWSTFHSLVNFVKCWRMHNYVDDMRRKNKGNKAKACSKREAGPNYRYNLRQTTMMRNGKMVVVFLVDRICKDHVDVFEKCEEQGRFQCILSYSRH